MRTFRSILRWLVPAWMSADEGGKLLEVWSALADASLQRMYEATLARFPSKAGPSALALIGWGRAIPRGRAESDTHYAARLKRWRYPKGHRVRGNAWSWLDQVVEYFGNAFAVRSIDAQGNDYARHVNGTEVYAAHGADYWVWDTKPATEWARAWLILDSPTRSGAFSAYAESLGDAELWGGAIDPSSDYTIGIVGLTPADADAIRELSRGAHPWRMGGARDEWAIVPVADATLAPADTWGRWSKVTALNVRESARSADFRYIALSATNSAQSGDPTLWTGLPLLSGVYVEEGDPTSFPGSATLPSGKLYAGDPVWIENIPLPDDGSHL